jgi:extracellular matrix regulatory protein A
MSNVALNVGFYNYVLSDKIVALVNSESAPMRRVIQEYRKSGRLIDATQGRKTKSVIFLEGGQVATSALPQDILVKRMLSDNGSAPVTPTAEESAPAVDSNAND